MWAHAPTDAHRFRCKGGLYHLMVDSHGVIASHIGCTNNTLDRGDSKKLNRYDSVLLKFITYQLFVLQEYSPVSLTWNFEKLSQYVFYLYRN